MIEKNPFLPILHISIRTWGLSGLKSITLYREKVRQIKKYTINSRENKSQVLMAIVIVSTWLSPVGGRSPRGHDRLLTPELPPGLGMEYTPCPLFPSWRHFQERCPEGTMCWDSLGLAGIQDWTPLRPLWKLLKFRQQVWRSTRHGTPQDKFL